MADIDFPDSPEIGDLFTVGDRTWRWTGVVWETITTTTAVGPQGPEGPQGPQGIQGEVGPTGPANTLSIGTVEPGETASATITGTAPDQVLNLVLPQGEQGIQGPAGGLDSQQVISSKSSNYSIVAGDAGGLIINSAAVIITVDDVLAVGQQVDFLQTSASAFTFVAGSGVTLNSKGSLTSTAAQGSPASIKCISAGNYWLVGDLG